MRRPAGWVRRQDRLALKLASHVLMLASRKTRARVRVALIRARDGLVPEKLLAEACFDELIDRVP